MCVCVCEYVCVYLVCVMGGKDLSALSSVTQEMKARLRVAAAAVATAEQRHIRRNLTAHEAESFSADYSRTL